LGSCVRPFKAVGGVTRLLTLISILSEARKRRNFRAERAYIMQITEKKILNFAFNSLLADDDLHFLIDCSLLLEFTKGEHFLADSIFLILEGSLAIINQDREIVRTYSQGLVGLDNIFTNHQHWQAYEIVCNTNLLVLQIDIQKFLSIVGNYRELVEFFRRQATELDLLLLHYKVSKSGLASRIDLIPYLGQLKQVLLEPGTIVTTASLPSGEFLIPYSGNLIHDSGEEVTLGNIYNYSSIDDESEWFSLDHCCLFVYEAEQLNTGQKFDVQDPENLTVSTIAFEDESANSHVSEPIFVPSKLPYRFQGQFKIQNVWHVWRKIFHSYPYFAQRSSNECGAACMKMLGLYWGKNLDYDRLLSITKADVSKSSLGSLIDAGTSVGFSLAPGKTDLAGLKQNDLPAIAHCQGNHYVVVYEVGKYNVVLNDPRCGTKQLTRSEFCDSWSGYVLWIRPTVELRQTPSACSIAFMPFWDLLKPYKVALAEVFAASVGIQLLSLSIPIFMQILLDKAVSFDSSATFWALGLGLLFARVVRELTVYLRRYLFFHLGNKLDLILIIRFVAHALKLPSQYYDEHHVGEIISRINENFRVRKFLLKDAVAILIDVLTIFLPVLLMCWYSLKLSILMLFIVPLLLIFTLAFTSILMQQSRDILAAATAQQSYLTEIFTGIYTVKSLGIRQTVRWHWEKLLNQYINVDFTAQMFQEKLRLVTALGETVISTSVLLIGIYLVVKQQLSIGQLVAFIMLFAQVLEPLKQINLLWQEFQEIRIAIERTQDLVNAPIEQELSEDLETLESISSIEFHQVTFKYDSQGPTQAIVKVSFAIAPGQTVALVGKNGSGKSTIAKLLLGFYRPDKGKIMVNGLDICNFKLSSLRKNIGVVNQDTYLFGGTIKDNLTIKCPQASEREIQRACKIACADEFIARLPLGYNTKIGEEGSLLSGGQRQRIAIARALLGSPSLLILDEATNSLDRESAKIIQHNLNNALAQQTTLTITNRLSTVKLADLILVLDRGSIIERGTHQELMEKKSYYQTLVDCE
jgi:ABC-type bacteriocin/lantibiotic exporter with double-glycine peptidase domain